MKIRISSKNMDIGKSFRQKIDDKITDIVKKYFDGGYSGHVTVIKSASQFDTDCLIRLDTGAVLQATGSDHDPNMSFDIAIQHLEKRLRRYKRRLKDHYSNTNLKHTDGDVTYSVVESLENIEEISENYSPTIVAESHTRIQSLTVAMAVMQLDMTENPVVVFRNMANEEINVVYRRKDGNIGWIDTAGKKNIKTNDK